MKLLGFVDGFFYATAVLKLGRLPVLTVRYLGT